MTSPTKIIDQNLPTVALIGRVNVGKSSLFNKLIERNLALVSKVAGTTRTRNVGTALWRGKNIRLVDTGGLTFDESAVLEDNVVAWALGAARVEDKAIAFDELMGNRQ